MATTPAADPIISILPPVPAEYAIKCQTGSSTDIENIPILAATRGTLSITAEPIPNNPITMSVFGIAVFNPSAKLKSKPKDSSAATASKIPKKNRILGSSILDNDLCTGLFV